MLKQISDEVMFEERTIAFRVVLLYEHEEGAQAAKAILDRVRARLPEAELAEISPWRFDRLGDPRAAQWARSHAADADLIVVAAKGSALPSQVEHELENWALEKAMRGYGFVLLLTDVPEPEKSKSPVYRYVRDLSRRTECDFFARGLKPRYVDRTEEALADQEFVAMAMPTRRWGIND